MVEQVSRLFINYDGQDACPTSDPLSCGDCFAPLAMTVFGQPQLKRYGPVLLKTKGPARRRSNYNSTWK